MKTLITPTEVMALAFSHESIYNTGIVTDLDVATTEERHLRPLLGEALYDKLLEGNYRSLRDEYVAPMVAAWIRYMVEPLLASRCDICEEAGATMAENKAIVERCHVLRQRARTLSRRLSDHLNTTAASYPEYDPNKNPLNRCSIDGNIVQVR